MTIPATVLELVVGLVADGIALSTFLAGLWGKSTEGESLPSLILFYVLSGLLIIYGWLTLSWVLTRRGLNYIPKARRAENFDRVVAQGVSGVGLGILPLFIVWSIEMGMVDPGMIMTVLFFGFFLAGIGLFVSVRYLMGLVYQDLVAWECFRNQPKGRAKFMGGEGGAPLRRHSRTALNGLPLTRLFGTRERRPVCSKPCRYAEASISEKPGAGKPCAGVCPEIVEVICAGAVE
jgi:hypothetical protein